MMTEVIVHRLVAMLPLGDVAPNSGVNGCSRVDAVDVISPWVSFQKRWGKKGDLAGCKDDERCHHLLSGCHVAVGDVALGGHPFIW